MSREMTLKYAKSDECKAIMTATLKFGPQVPITLQIKQLQDIKENMLAHSTLYPFIYFSKILLNPKCWGKDQGSQAAYRAYKHHYQEIYDQVVKNMPEHVDNIKHKKIEDPLNGPGASKINNPWYNGDYTDYDAEVVFNSYKNLYLP